MKGWLGPDVAADERNAIAFGLGSDAGEPDSQSLQPTTTSQGGTPMNPAPDAPVDLSAPKNNLGDKRKTTHGRTTLRFYVSEMVRYAGHDNVKISLKPAYNNGKGNEAWATATPSGDMWINVNNPSAVEWFEGCMKDKADIHITMERVTDVE